MSPVVDRQEGDHRADADHYCLELHACHMQGSHAGSCSSKLGHSQVPSKQTLCAMAIYASHCDIIADHDISGSRHNMTQSGQANRPHVALKDHRQPARDIYFDIGIRVNYNLWLMHAQAYWRRFRRAMRCWRPSAKAWRTTWRPSAWRFRASTSSPMMSCWTSWHRQAPSPHIYHFRALVKVMSQLGQSHAGCTLLQFLS